MTNEKTTKTKPTTSLPGAKIGQDAFFRKGGYQPAKTAPANPVVPSKPGTSTPAKGTSSKD